MSVNNYLLLFENGLLLQLFELAIKALAYYGLFHLVYLCKVAFCFKLFISIVVFKYDDSIKILS